MFPSFFSFLPPDHNLASLDTFTGPAGNLGTVDDLPNAVREHYDRYVSNGSLLPESLDGE